MLEDARCTPSQFHGQEGVIKAAHGAEAPTSAGDWEQVYLVDFSGSGDVQVIESCLVSA